MDWMHAVGEHSAMLLARLLTWQRMALFLAVLLILKVPWVVLLSYGDYFPPNFHEGFLQGRESYFFGGYQLAFYAHIVAGPLSLVLGLILVNHAFRRRWPRWHRRLGKIQAVNVLLLVAPSGLWMSMHAMGGVTAQLGFATLAVATASCVALGWRAAVQRRFAAHQAWMGRGFMLLCSAVVIRLFGGLATVLNAQAAWIDPVAAWACWVLPLAGYEVWRNGVRRTSKPNATRGIQVLRPHDIGYSKSTLSFPAAEISARQVSAESSPVMDTT